MSPRQPKYCGEYSGIYQRNLNKNTINSLDPVLSSI